MLPHWMEAITVTSAGMELWVTCSKQSMDDSDLWLGYGSYTQNTWEALTVMRRFRKKEKLDSSHKGGWSRIICFQNY